MMQIHVQEPLWTWLFVPTLPRPGDYIRDDKGNDHRVLRIVFIDLQIIAVIGEDPAIAQTAQPAVDKFGRLRVVVEKEDENA